MSDPEVEPTRVDLPTVADSGDATSVFVVDDGAGGPPYGGPPPLRPLDEPDRRPWIIVAVLAAIVAVLILVLVLGGDDDDSDTDATTTTSEVTSTSTSTSSSSSSTSTTAPTTTTTVASVVTVPPEECAEAGEGPAQPGPAATTVFDAWVRGDEACAAALMTPSALAELFDRSGADAQDEFQGCTEEDAPEPQADCAFTYEGGSTHYIMEFSDTDGWKVVDVTQVAD